MLAIMSHDSSSVRYSPQRYCTPRSLWWISPGAGERVVVAILSASSTILARRWLFYI